MEKEPWIKKNYHFFAAEPPRYVLSTKQEQAFALWLSET
jgi:hypothetical protein